MTGMVVRSEPYIDRTVPGDRLPDGQQLVQVCGATGLLQVAGEMAKRITIVHARHAWVRRESGQPCAEAAEVDEVGVSDPAVRGCGGMPKLFSQGRQQVRGVFPIGRISVV